jgi:hypothetical protein
MSNVHRFTGALQYMAASTVKETGVIEINI